MKKFNIVYQITNKLDNKIYIGCHQTNDINDKYMGSGTYLKRAMKKHGESNFERVILENFDNPVDMFDRERELVDEDFVRRKDTYNLIGGGHGSTVPFVTVKDKDGNCFNVLLDDPRYLSGEVKHVSIGLVTVKDKKGNTKKVSVTDPKYLSGELVHYHTGMVTAIDENGHVLFVTKEIFDSSNTLTGCSKNLVSVTTNGIDYFIVTTEEYRNNKNKYKRIWTGRRHTEESKRKTGSQNAIYQKGKGNSQYGTCWINKNDTNKKISKTEISDWLTKGWVKGRKITYSKHDGLEESRRKDFKKEYPKRGWPIRLSELWRITSHNAGDYCKKHFSEYFTKA